jgi:hypothetical protein
MLPIGLLSTAFVWSSLFAELRAELPEGLVERQTSLVGAWGQVVTVLCLAVVIHLWWITLVPTAELVGTGPYRIATGLAKFQNRHYTLVATEAGVIPYFSGWRAIDAWGLNDAEIVHNPKGLTDAYLEQNHPAVIMFHNSTYYSKDDYDRGWRGDAPPAENIKYLMEVESHYAATHGYVVAARWGESPCETDTWYLRKDLPEYEEMLAIIRQPGYFYPYGNAEHATNFLNAEPPAECSDDKAVVRMGN